MLRRWFLFLVCFGGGVPFFSNHANGELDRLTVRPFTALLYKPAQKLHRLSTCNHFQNVSRDAVHSALATQRISTPRPRQSPGFLPLHPQLTTDKEGQPHLVFSTHARVNCVMRLAEDKRIGLAATDFSAFVPFLTEFELISVAPISGTS